MPNNIAKGFIPEIFDASVYRTLEDNLVMKKLVRSVPIAAGKGKGDTVYFTALADPTISDYEGTITHEALKDDQIAMILDKEKTFAFKVADEDALMANVDLKGSQSSRAAYNLKDKVERDIFANIHQFAGTAQSATVTSANAISVMGEMQQVLAEHNVQENNMWIVIPPWLRLKLALAGIKFQINNGLNGKGTMAWTDELGFDVYVANTLHNSAATPTTKIMAGSYQALGYADIQLATRAMQLQNSRATGVDGGLIYGYKVIKPNELVCCTATFAAETTI